VVDIFWIGAQSGCEGFGGLSLLAQDVLHVVEEFEED
jgi:hypothetical protein